MRYAIDCKSFASLMTERKQSHLTVYHGPDITTLTLIYMRKSLSTMFWYVSWFCALRATFLCSEPANQSHDFECQWTANVSTTLFYRWIDATNLNARDATSFNIDLSPWNVTRLRDFTGAFRNATAFDKRLCWAFREDAIIIGMFCGSKDGYIAFLFIHGLLHLKGHDHGDTMESLERRYVKQFGIS